MRHPPLHSTNPLRIAALPATLASALLLLASVAAHGAANLYSDKSPMNPENRAALACTSTSNCVNSFDTEGLVPLRFEATAEQAMEALRATLAEFPKAKILKADASSMEVVFTTTLGFKDLVDFRVDTAAQRIDYRSRSQVGKYDFGKNRSRMTEFSTKFQARAQH